MRIYLPLEPAELTRLAKGQRLELAGHTGVTVTAEFAAVVETEDREELELIASLAASDLSATSNVVAVLETKKAEITDNELGEVQLQGNCEIADFECLLIADVDAQELSWFAVQEIDQLIATLGEAK